MRTPDEIALDLFASREARDEGFAAVAGREPWVKSKVGWMAVAMVKVSSLPPDWTGTGEDIRVHCMRQGAPMPHHSNAWGGLINSCIKAGLLHKTGQHGQMRAVRSHARSTPIYSRRPGR